MVNSANASWPIISATVSNTCPPKGIYSGSVRRFEAPVAAVIWLGFVAELYRKVAAIRVFAVAALTIPNLVSDRRTFETPIALITAS